MKRVTLFSAGAGSWLTAKAVAEKYPGDEHILLFADTLYEDADAYRFLIEGTANVLGRALPWPIPRAEDFPDYRAAAEVPLADYQGSRPWRSFLEDLRRAARRVMPELVWLVEGRDPWEVYRDERMLGNSRVDPCSKILKRRMLDRWRAANSDPASTVFYVGIDWTERHRFDDDAGGGIRPRMAAQGWTYEALLTLAPFASKPDALQRLRAAGIDPPRLYPRGYAHNNCGGMCCKAGHAHYAHRRRVDPERFAYDALMEAKCREFLGADVAMLTDRAGGNGKRPLTLAALGARLDTDPQMGLALDDWGGCGCMVEVPA